MHALSMLALWARLWLSHANSHAMDLDAFIQLIIYSSWVREGPWAFSWGIVTSCLVSSDVVVAIIRASVIPGTNCS